MDESLTKKTFKGFFWTTGGKLTVALVQIIVLAVLARLINAESFGLVQAALVVIGLAKVVSQMGIGPALVQRRQLSEIHIRVGFTFSLGLGLFLGLIIFLTAPLIASFFSMEGLTLVLKVVSLLFVTESFVTVSSSLIQREMRLKERAIVEISSYIVGYGTLGIIFGYMGFDYWALIFAVFGQELIRVIAYTILQQHSLKPYWRKKEFKDLIYFGGGFTIGKFFNYFANQGDNIMAGRYLGAEALGLYSRAYAIMSKPVSLIGDSMDKALFPAMAARQNDGIRLSKGFINGSKLILFVSLPITFIVFFSSEEIIRVLLGDKWLGAVLPLQILTLGLYFKMGYKMGDNLCRATGKVYKRANRQFIFALAVFTGTYLGAKFLGLEGVAWGILFAVSINYILMIGLSLKILEVSWLYYLKKLCQNILPLLLVSLSYIVIIYTVKMMTSSPLLILLISYSLFGSMTLMLLYFFGHRLNFLRILPFKNKINKFIRRKL